MQVIPGAVFHAIWHIKKRLFGPGGVANPHDTTRYRRGLCLARTKTPLFLWVPASAKHGTIDSARIIREPRSD
jgi:hypothetical protein